MSFRADFVTFFHYVPLAIVLIFIAGSLAYCAEIVIALFGPKGGN